MRPRRRWTRANVLALAAFLLAVSLAGWSLDRALEVDPFPAALPGAERAPDAGAIARAEAPPEKELRVAIENDPFHPERRPPAEPYRLPGGAALAAGPVQDPDAGPLRLIGTVVLPEGRSFAMCQWGTESPRIVRVGEAIGGLTLSEVGQGAAVFRSASGEAFAVRVPKPGA